MTIHAGRKQTGSASNGLAPAGAAVPPAWDWRSVNGRNFVSAVKNQGTCNSSVAFGVAATVDARMRITAGVAVNDPNGMLMRDLSEAQLFYCGGAHQGFDCKTGW